MWTPGHARVFSDLRQGNHVAITSPAMYQISQGQIHPKLLPGEIAAGQSSGKIAVPQSSETAVAGVVGAVSHFRGCFPMKQDRAGRAHLHSMRPPGPTKSLSPAASRCPPPSRSICAGWTRYIGARACRPACWPEFPPPSNPSLSTETPARLGPGSWRPRIALFRLLCFLATFRWACCHADSLIFLILYAPENTTAQFARQYPAAPCCYNAVTPV